MSRTRRGRNRIAFSVRGLLRACIALSSGDAEASERFADLTTRE
jgi:hypothetical protein